MLIGDFNCVNNIQGRTETTSRINLSKTKSFALKEMIAGLDLVDIWKKLKNDELGHTFHHPFGSSRLDRIYGSRCIAEEFTSIFLQPILISDH